MDSSSRSSDLADLSGGPILEWIDALRPLLAGSSWGPALEVQGVDVLDAVFGAVYLRLLRLQRNDPPPAREPLSNRWRGALLRRLQILQARARSTPPAPTKIVFWPREPTHVRVHIAVAAELDALGVASSFIACRPAIAAALAAAGRASLYPRRVWSEEIEAARRQSRDLALRLTKPPTPLPQAGLPVAPTTLGTTAALEIVGRELAAQLPVVAEAAVTTRAILEHLRPRLLVVGNDLTLEGRVGARIAAAEGTRTALLMHGLLAREAIETRHIADRFLVYGARSRELLAGVGYPAGQLTVTGTPLIPPPASEDSATTEGHLHDRAVRALERELGCNPRRQRILVATSGPGHSVSEQHHRRWIETLQALAQKEREIDFLVKLHRKDRRVFYQALADPKAHPNVWLITDQSRPQLSMQQWIGLARAVITGGSTVALEAMSRGVPVLTIDLCEELQDVEFIVAGATLHSTTGEQLRSAIRHVLSGDSEASSEVSELVQRARAFADETFHQPPQGAARCAAETLLREISADSR